MPAPGLPGRNMVKRSTFGAQSEYNSIGKRQSLVASDGEPSPIGLRLEQYDTISPLSLAAIGSNPGMSVFEEKIIPSKFFRCTEKQSSELFSLHRKKYANE